MKSSNQVDWEWQQRMCAETIVEERIERNVQALALSLVQLPAFQRAMRAEIERNKQRKPVYTSSGLITTRSQPDLRQMHADLARNNRRLEELRRRVQRERAGYR